MPQTLHDVSPFENSLLEDMGKENPVVSVVLTIPLSPSVAVFLFCVSVTSPDPVL